ncbi:hypothetical protein E5D57_003544 [Metarhizium anisopliae]|nr:hypothetical protein E5D57_003544 [Metarhizium anisopliae]
MAQLLAAAGASVHQSCSGGKGSSTFDNEFLYGTPLRRATGLDNLACVKALLKLGADPYNGGDEYKPPIAEACLGHYDKILEQFLPPHFDVRHPGWYRQPLLRKRDILESVTAIVMRPKSMALGAPRAWANMERQGNAKSLLGYAVNPNLLHERMAHCGPGWKASMRRTIDLILDKGEEDHMRVTPWNTSSILEAVGSGDVDIVSYILDKCADTVTPLLSYPRPNGYSLWLPIHGAIAQRNRRVFDRLLQVAGPETPLGPPQRTGLKNWFLAKRFELFGEKIGTCPPGQQFATVLHMCANTTVDPYFAEALLAKLSREEAETMVMTPGHFGEMPLTCALCNQSFGLAELLLARGASLEDGGRPGPTLAAMVAGIGTSWSEYWALSQANASLQGGQSLLAWVLRLNNEPSTAAVKWLLERGANFMVDETLGLSALHVAVLAGQRFNLEPGSNRRIFFYGCNLANLHVLLKRFTSKDQLDLTDRLLGLTALQMAVLQLDVKAVQMLKKAGASLETESTEGLTALQLMQRAAEESAPAQLEYLRRIEDLEMLLNLEH